MAVLLRLRSRLWAILVGTQFQRAIEQNEHAAAELDAAVREVLQK